MQAKISSDVKVWDKNGDPVYYDDLDDLTEKLEKLLTPDCKIIPVLHIQNITEPTIVQLRIVTVDTELCPKCNREVDPTTNEVYSWHGYDRYLHSSCIDSIIEKATNNICQTNT